MEMKKEFYTIFCNIKIATLLRKKMYLRGKGA